jgi:hypothetical protein
MRVNNSVYRGFFVFALAILFSSAKSQNHHFIYILADQQQPFYVRTTEKVYSSSGLGYLIIPRLSSGKISFTIGFPKNKWKSSKYSIELNENDLYLSFKQVDSTTWGLYDKQTNLVYIPEEINQPAKMDTSKDPFSVMLAEVSDNPTILQQKKKEVQSAPALIEDTTSLGITRQNDTQIQVIAVKEIPLTSNNVITVQKENQRNRNKKIDRTMYLVDSTGISIGYEIIEGDNSEKVVIFIPKQQDMPETETKPTVGKKKRKKQQEQVAVKEQDLSKVNDIEKKQIETKELRCENIATEADFRMIRKMLASEDDEELMVVVADTTMGNSQKCFSSEQVRNLAVLFLNDRIRLQFVESAIVHLSDYGNASLLESLFQDEENRKKIKATIEKNQR